MNIRLLTPEDVQVYRELRLRSLIEEPESFGLSYEEYSAKPLEQISRGLEVTNEQWALGAFDENRQLVGVAGWTRKKSIKTRHKSEIWGVYVIPEQRGKGIAKSLLQQLIDKVKEQREIEQIQLAVNINSNARFLYQSVGFKTFAIEENASKIGDMYVDEEYMVYFLKKS